MVKIIDKSPKEFYKEIQDKEVYLFGAGRTAEHFGNVFCKDKEIRGIIDNNAKIQGNIYNLRSGNVEVISLDKFISICRRKRVQDIALLVTPVFWAGDILTQLDMIPELNDLCCYLGFLLRNNSKEKEEWNFSQGENRIPKKIHYIWFGGHPIPAHLQRYIDTWTTMCPDYEIIRWDESNYDFRKNEYMKQAYESKKWGFVSDCARLDIIYENGGIYLDTDVELIKSLDDLLKDNAFFGFYGNDQINTGSGFGAVKKHGLIKQLRDYYCERAFIKDGNMIQFPCYRYQHPVLENKGFKIENRYQKIDNIVIYPSEVLSPSGMSGMADFFSEKSIGIHHTELSWISEEERIAFERMKKRLLLHR